jgi:hypothetical protein
MGAGFFTVRRKSRRDHREPLRQCAAGLASQRDATTARFAAFDGEALGRDAADL